MPAPLPIGSLRKSPTTAVAAVPIDSEFRKKIDRFGYLDARYYEAKAWLDERETLKKAIQEHYKDHPADQPVHIEGDLYLVELTIREEQQRITDKAKAFAALRKKIGLTALIEALTFTLKLLDQHIPKDKQGAFVTKERTGPRTIRSIVKAAPEAA